MKLICRMMLRRDRFKTISQLRLRSSVLWMLFRQRDKQLLCWLILQLSRSHTALISFTLRLIILHFAHYIRLAARKLPLMSFFNLTLLPRISSSKACRSFA